ncbi:hypothetical protein LSAT2_029676 [Lamellibrachia satsuma]|nr:hypothetical protein LSAT2_029676 [Lamellibrachia satsuma]
MIRMRCHCQLVVQHVPCDQWTHADDRERQRLKSCHSSCPKMLPCGHQCKSTCHPNGCPNLDRCTEKVKVRCQCRRRKQDFLCNEVQAGYAKVECDETCQRQREKTKKDKEESDKQHKLQEEQRQKEEYEEFERKIHGRKRKARKPKQETNEPRFLQRYGKFIIAPLLILLFALFVYFLLQQ